MVTCLLCQPDAVGTVLECLLALGLLLRLTPTEMTWSSATRGMWASAMSSTWWGHCSSLSLCSLITLHLCQMKCVFWHLLDMACDTFEILCTGLLCWTSWQNILLCLPRWILWGMQVRQCLWSLALCSQKQREATKTGSLIVWCSQSTKQREHWSPKDPSQQFGLLLVLLLMLSKTSVIQHTPAGQLTNSSFFLWSAFKLLCNLTS